MHLPNIEHYRNYSVLRVYALLGLPAYGTQIVPQASAALHHEPEGRCGTAGRPSEGLRSPKCGQNMHTQLVQGI